MTQPIALPSTHEVWSVDKEILHALLDREPLFHRRKWIHSAETFDAGTAEDFWEVGGSGRAYDREYVRGTVLARLTSDQEDAALTESWTISEPAIRKLSDETFLLTYVLTQPARKTRRATVWSRTLDGVWQALYHQGTVILSD